MRLSQDQIEYYNRNGYLIVENLFTASEIHLLKERSEEFEDLKYLPSVVCETNGDIRSVFAPHVQLDAFDWLYRQERLVTPAQQLLGNSVYLYQYKLNNKKAYGGDWWEWHQDFVFWHRDDGVHLPQMVSAMILFQDTRSVQGPLLFVPGSHHRGIAALEDKPHLQDKEGDLMNALNADLKYTINKKLLKKLAEDSGIAVGEGPIGTCIFFHPNLFHASNSNISPFDRYTAILTYNDTTNLPEERANNRPEYICSRNFDPIRTRTDALVEVPVMDKQALK